VRRAGREVEITFPATSRRVSSRDRLNLEGMYYADGIKAGDCPCAHCPWAHCPWAHCPWAVERKIHRVNTPAVWENSDCAGRGHQAKLAAFDAQGSPLAYVAYGVATSFQETGAKMQPVPEIGRGQSVTASFNGIVRQLRGT
jgi:hypothetical protein